MKADLIRKYNVPGPRYTSYPTVPYWDQETFSVRRWKQSLVQSATEDQSSNISLYIHLPFCEKMCTFCGCTKRITKNHNVEAPYIDTLLKEWQLYLDILPVAPSIKEIHLGGGTPTFFHPRQLERLLSTILKSSTYDNPEISFEGHPNNTTEAHLKSLFDIGCRRVSFGVQDYDPLVQKAINRIQPFENVLKVHTLANKIGYASISHDLVFGLPHQSLPGIEETIKKTLQLKPDRISFYSYAHVPWIKGIGQRGFNEADLPRDSEKRILYEIGKELFFKNGYHEIGMDHFALPHDDLYHAMHNKTLHRNFMGYTTTNTNLMIGLGMSAIGDTWYAFSQNVKDVEAYMKQVELGQFPVFRGHLLNPEDLTIRRHILNLMCHFETNWKDNNARFAELDQCLDRLTEMEKDGLVRLSSSGIHIPEEGRPFIRNICMAFDMRLFRNKPATRSFSMTV